MILDSVEVDVLRIFFRQILAETAVKSCLELATLSNRLIVRLLMDNQADITVQTVATQGSHIQHVFKGTV